MRFERQICTWKASLIMIWIFPKAGLALQEKAMQKLWQHNAVVLFMPMLAMSVFRK
jgi:hypothetical protein